MDRQSVVFFRILVVFCVALISVGTTQAQSVSTDAVSTLTYCPGDNISVSYVATGTFGAKNAFSLQLSGPDGSFGGSFLTLGSIKSGTSGTIVSTIPTNVSAGAHYRVRVIASNPYVVGTDNGTDLTLGQTPSASFWPSKSLAMVGDTITYYANGSDSAAGVTYNWDFGPDATPLTATTASVAVVYATGGPKTASLNVTGQLGCTSSSTMRTDSGLGLAMKQGGVTIIDCNTQIPAEARIDSTEDPSGPAGITWVVPGATFSTGGGGGHIVFAEPGAKVITGGGGSCTFYLKDGSSLELGGGGSHVIVAGNGAGVYLAGGAKVFRCANMTFDYSVAPPYKIKLAGIVDPSRPKLSLYPNPAASMLFVEVAQRPNAMRIRDELGAEMLSATGDFSNLLQIDLRTYPAGTYYLELEYPGARTVDRFVVER